MHAIIKRWTCRHWYHLFIICAGLICPTFYAPAGELDRLLGLSEDISGPENIKLGVKINVNDPEVRRKFQISNIKTVPEHPGTIEFVFVSGDEKEIQGTETVNIATVRDGIVVIVSEAVRIYFSNLDGITDAFDKAVAIYALGLQLDRSIIGSRKSIPKEIGKSKAIQIAEKVLGIDASDEEKAREAIKVSSKLGIRGELWVAIQKGNIITIHRIMPGKTSQGRMYYEVSKEYVSETDALAFEYERNK